MLLPGKLVYTKRFPRSRPDDRIIEEAVKKAEAAKKTPFWTEYKKYFKQLEKRTVYVEKPEKMEKRQQFIDLAKQLAEDGEIDTDIREYANGIFVSLYLSCGDYGGAAKDLFCALLKQCDDVSVLGSFKETFDFTVYLMYETHECCISGCGEE